MELVTAKPSRLVAKLRCDVPGASIKLYLCAGGSIVHVNDCLEATRHLTTDVVGLTADLPTAGTYTLVPVATKAGPSPKVVVTATCSDRDSSI